MSDTLRSLFSASPQALLDDDLPPNARSEKDLREAAGEVDGLQRVALGCILLRHGLLHPAHDESQAISGPYGDWLHAIMHRMEGDYGNSHYWCRRAGGAELYEQVSDEFTPAKLTDLVAGLHGQFTGEAAEAAQILQARELEVLFEHSAG
ncbi:MAG: hypothetical protein PF961_12185 [Planctomycetota bacterium]|jgi:hypothetical protein|nr:hypothetical protein [Planctomycetota bacterium]